MHRVVSDEWRLGLALSAGAALLVGMSLQVLVKDDEAGSFAAFHAVGHALVYVSLALGAVHGLRAAWESIRELKPDIDVLMVVGAGLAAVFGHPGDGALLLFMFTLAGALEHRALAKARDAVSRLARLMPNEALRRAEGGWKPVKPDDLRPGDVVLIRAGETVPADGRVIAGASTVDQSALTGESLPRNVDAGDDIFAGTLNQAGALEAEVLRPIAESSLKKITALVIEAQAQRQPLQRIIDRLSTPYTICVFIAALAVFAAFSLIGRDFSGEPIGIDGAAIRAITLLIVASPCALVIATPTATLCGLNRAARAGLLVKGGEALERLARVRTIVVDKTGTLTTGQIEVTSVRPIPDASASIAALLPAVLAMEERSTHPIAAAITRYARAAGASPAEVRNFQMIAGRGIVAEWQGREVRIGTPEFVCQALCTGLCPLVQQAVHALRLEGAITAALACDGRAAVFALSDTARPGARAFVSDTRAVGVERIVMLTGDNEVIARKVAAELHIDEVHASLLPEQKVDHVRRIRASLPPLAAGNHGLAVIGDGVNDAPSLAAADVGLAMGGVGADAALEAADVVVLADDLAVVPWGIGLAKRARRIMMINLAFAVGVIVLLAAAAVVGVMPIGVGVVGHEGSTLVVVGLSLTLLGMKESGQLNAES